MNIMLYCIILYYNIYIYIYIYTYYYYYYLMLYGPFTANLHTQILEFRGFRSGRIVIFRG